MDILEVKLLLLSGGLESTALAYWLRPDVAVTVDYGQIASAGEIAAARAVAAELSIPHVVVAIDARALGQGSMVGGKKLCDGMPPEWWPFRNQFLATVAAMRFADSSGGEILIGTVAGDEAHCDGRKAFVDALDATLASQKPCFRFKAPAIDLTTLELLRLSGAPASLLGWTFSCHVASVPCGECRGCWKHSESMYLLDAPEGSGRDA
jgi:7-cyano-7-deazaguanine synthase